MMSIKEIVSRQHHHFKKGATENISGRIDQLKKLKQVIKDNEPKIQEALEKDFKKPVLETYATELGVLYTEIDFVANNLRSWAQPEKVRGSIINFPSHNTIYREPYGVALVIGAWNYPVHLTLYPVIGALAAGNCVIAKPSEIAAHSSALMAKFINATFEPGLLHIVEGNAETTQQLLKEPLDYIFFTGSTRVGKIVMKAAAEQLTPVTLEMGGKSPAIVDETAKVPLAAKRIAWGKFLNAGQTCVAPDYVYVHASVQKELINKLKKSITEFYGEDPRYSDDYARIINDDHFKRLKGYLNDGTTRAGGVSDEDERYIAPTILSDIDWQDKVMKEEIFGPILPVLSYSTIDTAIDRINNHPNPLALYVFSEDKKQQKRVINEISFGGGCINDTVAHLANIRLPFGGMGQSGMGNYHGKTSFDTFSRPKSIMNKTTLFDIPMRYPPYKGKLKWIKKLIK